MKAVVLEIEDDIFERVIAFLNIFPDNKLKIVSDIVPLGFVSKAEQQDIENLLSDPECFESEYRTVQIN